jgi:hypothetical protein
MEVYCYDETDWKLYGFPFSMNGDHVVVDFEQKKRKKFAIIDFDEGEQTTPFANVFAQAVEQYNANDTQWATKYQTASDTILSMESELGNLRQFKTDTENAIAQGERDEVFAQFEDLVGVEAFEALREHCVEYSIEDLEEKCFAIRGRNGMQTKFSYKSKAPKLPIERGVRTEEPYGGIFAESGIASRNQHN